MSQQSRPPTRESRRIRGLSPPTISSPPPTSPSSPSPSLSSVNLRSTVFPGINSTIISPPVSPNPSTYNPLQNPSLPNTNSSFNHYYSASSTPPIHPSHNSHPHAFTPPHVSDASFSQYNSVLHPPHTFNPYNLNNFRHTPSHHPHSHQHPPQLTSSPGSTISSHTHRSTTTQPPSQFISIPSPHSSSLP